MKIATSRLKEAVNKVTKGAGFNNLIPLTSMIGIKLSEGKLRLLSTDMTNTLCVVIDKVAGDDVDITIPADVFSKLIAKVTSEEVELTVDNSILTVKANGKYKIPVIADEEGEVSFPDITLEGEFEGEVNLTSIMAVYNINKSSLAKTMERPELTGYYMGDTVISTDANVICFNGMKLFNTPVLMSAQMLNLLTLNTSEKIKYSVSGTQLEFMTDDVIVVGPSLAGITDYPVEEINAYLEEAFPSMCKIPKELMISVLDRLALFIEPYDKNGAYFSFGRKGIDIHSKKEASTEIINYVESKDFAAFVCCVDIPMFKEQLNANPDDTVELWYGNENALKLVSGKVTQIVALLEDDELGN